VKGRSITLKLKRCKRDAPEPVKFLGHGPCDNLSRYHRQFSMGQLARYFLRCVSALQNPSHFDTPPPSTTLSILPILSLEVHR